MKLYNFYNEKIAPAFDVPAAAVGGGTGHFLSQHTEITGMAGVDIFIKVVVPVLTGLVVPVLKQWFQDRKEARDLRRAEIESKIRPE